MSDRARDAASESASALARAMRAFDGTLDDAQLAEIASAVDAARAEGRALANVRPPLENGDEPVTTFAADPP